MKRFAWLFVAMLFAVLSVVGSTRGASADSATDVQWRWVGPLPWSSGATSKNFTASITDTSSFQLPQGIDWGTTDFATLATYNALTVAFVVTGAAAANADTVHYVQQCQVGGVNSFVDLRDVTPDVWSSAIQLSAGLLYIGRLGYSPNSRGVTIPGPCDGRIKVSGDPNGALNGLKAYVYAPFRVLSR